MLSHAEITHDLPEFVGTGLSFGDVDDVLLVCHGRDTLPDDEWQVLLQRIAVADYSTMLVSTLGAGPLPAQRYQLVDCYASMERHPPRIAVLSASPAMRWVNAALRFLSKLDATTLRFDATLAATRFLECRANARRIDAARARAHYLLEKKALKHEHAH